MLVDLFTYDRELDALILEGYEGRLIPETQYGIDESEPGAKIFCFYNLEKKEIEDFLMPYKRKHTYEIHDTEGNLLEVNDVNLFEAILFNEN